ncbi:MAG: hypothetical protein P9L99_13145 [Candidatus Lernaella stagnicola]|nr:hypothetical protein [Candidatus Lernaella stagnicola]
MGEDGRVVGGVVFLVVLRDGGQGEKQDDQQRFKRRAQGSAWQE